MRYQLDSFADRGISFPALRDYASFLACYCDKLAEISRFSVVLLILLYLFSDVVTTARRDNNRGKECTRTETAIFHVRQLAPLTAAAARTENEKNVRQKHGCSNGMSGNNPARSKYGRSARATRKRGKSLQFRDGAI